MHDALGEVAWRRGRRWIVAAAVLLGMGIGTVGLFGGVVGFAVVSLVAIVASYFWLVSDGRTGVARPHHQVVPAPPQVANLAEGIGLATGTRPAAVLRVLAEAPDVGALPVRDGWDLFVTDGALARFTADEVEALSAAQLASVVDPKVRRLRAAAGRLSVLRGVSFLLAFVLGMGFFVSPVLGVVSIGLVVAVAVAAWLTGGSVRFWARVAVDAAAVATTRHPQPLVSALVRMAEWNGAQVSLGAWGWAGLCNRWWVRGRSVNWTSTTTINGKVTDRRTREQVEDVALLVRAGLVRRVCIEGADADLASYNETRAAVRAAGRAAAQGGSAVVEGRAVGLGGVVGGDGGEPGVADAMALATSLLDVLDRTGLVDVPSPAAPTGPLPAPGWYADPWAPAVAVRWWDGTRWTPAHAPQARPGR